MSTGSDADVLIGSDFNKDTPLYSNLSSYEDVNGGNKQGGSFKRIPAAQLKGGVKEGQIIKVSYVKTKEKIVIKVE